MLNFSEASSKMQLYFISLYDKSILGLYLVEGKNFPWYCATMGNDMGGDIRRLCEMIEALSTFVYRHGVLSTEEYRSICVSTQQLKNDVYLHRILDKSLR
jgi:hypothetical protein